MVEETFKYAATPEDAETATAAWHDIQTCREVSNHALTQEYRPRPDYDKPSYADMQNKLTGATGWKQRWPEWKRVYSKCLQMAIRRITQSESVPESLQTRGYNGGQLKWKPPGEFRTIVFDILLRVTAAESHATAPLGWECQGCRLPSQHTVGIGE